MQRPLPFLLISFPCAFLGFLGGPLSAQDPANDNYGFYTDRPGYDPGEDITIYANWPKPAGPRTVTYKLWRIGDISDTYSNKGESKPENRNWVDANSSVTQVYDQYTDGTTTLDYPIPPRYGSFVEFPLSLSGLSAFTLEGWVSPQSLIPPPGTGDSSITYTLEDVVVAGQIDEGLISSASGGTTVTFGGACGIGLTPEGYVVGYLATDNSSSALIVSNSAIGIGEWHHLGLTYNGQKLKLWVDGIKQADVANITGNVAGSAGSFRIGAKSEAPGDKTGLLDGRVDNWSVFNVAMPKNYFQALNGLATLNIYLEPATLLLSAKFDDTYGTAVQDSSGLGNSGQVINHGTPGVAGHVASSQALRLNFDQLVNLAWPDPLVSGAPQTVKLNIPMDSVSGLYVVEALLDAEVYAPLDKPLQTQCIVVRPKSTPTPAQVAVIVPVNTWTAYNGWPGSSTNSFAANGISPRLSTINPGNNSAYLLLGDGSSHAHFHGWRRPNTKASPYAGNAASGYFSVLAPGSVTFFQWLAKEAQALANKSGTQVGFSYAVYTDWDLDDPNSPLFANPPGGSSIHKTWMTIAHPEYWTKRMLSNLNSHLGSGGNVLSIAGNALLWRCDVDPEFGVMETRKWPYRLTLEGPQDGQTLIGDHERTGAWRMLNQCVPSLCVPSSVDPKCDYLLGNITDTNACGGGPLEFPGFVATDPNHWLFNGNPPSASEKFGLMSIEIGGVPVYCGGHETDRYEPGRDSPQLAMGGAVEIIAHADPLDLCPSVPTFDWNPLLALPQRIPEGSPIAIYTVNANNCEQLDLVDPSAWGIGPYGQALAPAIESFPDSLKPEVGTILTYSTSSGGRVVSIPSTGATWSLGVMQTSEMHPDHLTVVAENALRCMVFGDCP